MSASSPAPVEAPAPATDARPTTSAPPSSRAARVIGARPRMSRFRKVLLGLTTLCHVPFVVGVTEFARRLGAPTYVAVALALTLATLGVYLFLGRAERIANDAKRTHWGTFLFDVPYYVHWCACVFCLLPSLAYVALAPLVDVLRGQSVALAPGFFLWTYALGLVVALYGVTLRRWWFVTRRHDVRVRGLDPRLEGFRIVHLSDLHIGALTPAWWARRWVARANALEADLVAVTGDLVTSGVAFHDDIADVIGELRGRLGVFCAMGNHDYFGEGEPLVSLLRARGSKVLRNEGLVVERNGAKLFVSAIDDTWTRRANIERALETRPANVPTVMLAHDPDTFPKIARRGVELVLSGHTHGGQIAVPFVARWLNVSRFAHRFHLGIYRDGDSTLYVHPGLGTTGPPVRFGVAPAIVLLTLRAG